MITGRVQGREARIRLPVRGPRKARKIEAVIDTGYTASLTLPSEVITLLNLKWMSISRGILADGSECLFDVYEARVEWNGVLRRILVDEADTDPLIGMDLMAGHELRMQVRPRGKVTIKKLPRR